MATGNARIDDWVHSPSGESLSIETKNSKCSGFGCGGKDSRDGCLSEAHFDGVFGFRKRGIVCWERYKYRREYWIVVAW